MADLVLENGRLVTPWGVLDAGVASRRRPDHRDRGQGRPPMWQSK